MQVEFIVPRLLAHIRLLRSMSYHCWLHSVVLPVPSQLASNSRPLMVPFF